MLHAELTGEFGTSMLAGSADVEALQKALNALAQAAGWPAVKTTVTGTVDNGTVMAVATVIGELSGDMIDGSIKTAIQAATVIAAASTEAMAAAKSLVGQYAGYLTKGVQALTLVYTQASSAPSVPAPPAPTESQYSLRVGPSAIATGYQQRATEELTSFPKLATTTTTSATAAPTGSITAFDFSTNLWRLAVPRALAAQLGGPSVQLAESAYVERPAQRTRPDGATVVTVSEFEKKVGDRKFFRTDNPWLWALLGGGALAVGGGLFWYTRTRR